MPTFLEKVFGDPNKKVIKELRERAATINALEPSVQAFSDAELTLKSTEFKKRFTDGETLDALLPEAFAVVREVARRKLGQRHFDVQMMGGIVLHRGGIAEMRTGEGKTLTATAPVYLNALAGKGVHLITVNDYLAKRDAVWMGQVYHALGLSVATIEHDAAYIYDPHYKVDHGTEEEKGVSSFKVEMDYLRPVSRKEAYQADITYGTNNEFGFDYLRDNMVTRIGDKAQRGLNYAIIDEVDSILIDEARTPLIISAPAEESADLYQKFSRMVTSLTENDDFNIDEKMRAVTLTDAGIHKMEQALGIENLYVGGESHLVHHMEQALRAQTLFKLDRDYVVREGEVVIVDEFTGRLMQGRRYSDGLHQAIEAKEGVEIKRESQTLATITFQNLFRMYGKLSGMTGTAATEAEEFSKIYNLEVTAIPTNHGNARADLPDRVYKSELGKFQAVVREVGERHAKGQPMLIGTASIEKNEILGSLLRAAGIPYNLLNAKNHEKEGEIIAQAGRPGSVTVATNMAGRGVDIILGGNPPDAAAASSVKELGGLFVIGTERHESRRIDNQLRGRSGRQGDPGVTQFYVSMEDDLMRIFGSSRIKFMMDKLGIPEDMPIENKMVTGSLEKAQQRVEGNNFDTRKHLLEYDDVLNKHRLAIYTRRDELLNLAQEGEEGAVKQKLVEMLEAEVEQVVLFHTGETPHAPAAPGATPDTDVKEIAEVVATIIPLADDEKSALKAIITPLSRDKFKAAEQRETFIKAVLESAEKVYNKFVADVPDASERKQIETSFILRAMDRLWIEHLTVMRDLRTSIGLKSYGQLDPLVEYKRESRIYFQRLEDAMQGEVAYNFFKMALHVAAAKKALAAAPSLLERAGVMLSGAAKTMGKNVQNPVQRNASAPQQGAEVVAQTPEFDFSNVGRNDLCPCGSGKKFKKCHGA
ncbi:MAG: preprotein translocase subunit SecA [Patescibacteria group bacterium]